MSDMLGSCCCNTGIDVLSIDVLYLCRCNTVIMYVCCRVEGGELFDRVVQLGKLDESTAKLFFYQMALAIKV